MIGEIEAVVDSLNRAQVRYLVVGGVAVVLHGYLRTTADLDLVIHLAPDNALRAVKALAALQYRPRAPVNFEAFAQREARESWLREKGLTVFSLWSPARPTLEIVLFVSEPFDFEVVYARALRVRLQRSEATGGVPRRSDRSQEASEPPARSGRRSRPGGLEGGNDARRRPR